MTETVATDGPAETSPSGVSAPSNSAHPPRESGYVTTSHPSYSLPRVPDPTSAPDSILTAFPCELITGPAGTLVSPSKQAVQRVRSNWPSALLVINNRANYGDKAIRAAYQREISVFLFVCGNHLRDQSKKVMLVPSKSSKYKNEHQKCAEDVK